MRFNLLRQASAYMSVAGLSAVSDWLVFTLISWLTPERDVVFAQAVARLTGGLVAFLLHRSWSFRDQQGLGLGTEAGRFLALYAFSFTLSLATVYVLVDLLGFNRFLSKAFADTLCFVVNFFVMKLWVFNTAAKASAAGVRSSGME
jgi:putative flippase GtrA